jgi:hypothetical protein
MAARLNFKLQACLIGRRFAHRSRHDPSSLAQFAGDGDASDLMEHSPDDRAQILARTLARIRDGHEPATPEGDVRRAFYLAYNDSYCEYLEQDEVEQRVEGGEQVVSANFVTPYPPGFPVLVPGQLFSPQILEFMRNLDTPEVHGYRPDLGYRVYVDKALEIAAIAQRPPADQADPG